MALFVYETALEYESSDNLLLELRETVSKLRSYHPELKHCSLADISLRKNKASVNVTLFFQPEY